MLMDIKTSKQPPIDEPLMVSYGDYECLAYFDRDGACRNWYSDKVIKNVKEWVMLEY